MRQQQSVHLLRHLVAGIVADTGQSGKLVWRGNELTCPLGCRPSDRVVRVAPDEQGWLLGRADGLVADASFAGLIEQEFGSFKPPPNL